MTDDLILQRLIDGNLRIHPETAVVESFSACYGWHVLKSYLDTHDSGYAFVKISWKTRQKKIAVHRLQWMACHMRLVPAGFDVHHVKAPPRPLPKSNHIGNLELRESLINQSAAAPDYPGYYDAYATAGDF